MTDGNLYRKDAHQDLVQDDPRKELHSSALSLSRAEPETLVVSRLCLGRVLDDGAEDDEDDVQEVDEG